VVAALMMIGCRAYRSYASEWSLLSMYLLFIAVVTFRARGLFGKKSALDV
jgi:ABC-type branched-subunit amino acid transport system permease subunit